MFATYGDFADDLRAYERYYNACDQALTRKEKTLREEYQDRLAEEDPYLDTRYNDDTDTYEYISEDEYVEMYLYA